MMDAPKIEFDDDDMDDYSHVGATIDLFDEKSLVSVSPSDEFMLSDSSDNLVAYRIVHVPDESKDQQLFEATTSSGSAAAPQQVQYFVIDNSNGIVQAVQSPQITVTTAAASATAAPAKSDSASGTSKSPKARTSIAIAPKATVTKSNTSELLNSLRKRDEKRDDRRRATHNEVERRRRDKINHWIMKLGSIIPADGKAHEIGTSGRISIAAIEGQSKGGILSKAFEYVQTLQTKRGADGKPSNGGGQTTTSDTVALEKKKREDEIARLRGENELLKAILAKHGINYVKERHLFRPNDYSS